MRVDPQEPVAQIRTEASREASQDIDYVWRAEDLQEFAVFAWVRPSHEVLTALA